jgi:hypothetical protein
VPDRPQHHPDDVEQHVEQHGEQPDDDTVPTHRPDRRGENP